MNEPCPAGKPCLGGHGLLLKGSDTIVVIRMGSVGSHHGRNSIFSVENGPFFGPSVENQYKRPLVETQSFGSRIHRFWAYRSKIDLNPGDRSGFIQVETRHFGGNHLNDSSSRVG